MYKWLMIACVVVMMGDPSLSWLEAVQETKDALIAAMFAVVTAPWVVAQFDN